MVVFWGAVLCFSAVVHNFAGVMVTRFFLGAGEGSITAGTIPKYIKRSLEILTRLIYRIRSDHGAMVHNSGTAIPHRNLVHLQWQQVHQTPTIL